MELLRQACLVFLSVKSRGSFRRSIKRLGISYQRARTYFHSPDAAYEDKLAYMRQVIPLYSAGQVAVLCQDELTYYNHASVAADYRAQKQQPKAGLAIGGEKSWRVAGALDIFSGAFIAMQRQAIRVPTFVEFLRQIVAQYPQQTIYVLLDNWPLHFHPDVLQALQTQQCPYPFLLPASWKKFQPSGKYKGENLPIQLVPLPTYASWLNPIEKVWKHLKQQIIHNHAFANNFKELKLKVEEILQGVDQLRDQILSLTGLKNPKGIFAEQIKKAGVTFSP